MTKHSKNNTAAATFTYAEYKKLDYDPLCCTNGHLACKECFYNHILSQKKLIDAELKKYEADLKTFEDEKKRKEVESVEKEVVDFHKVQNSLVEEKPDLRGGKPSKAGPLAKFWLTPEASTSSRASPAKPAKTRPTCFGGGEDHHVSIKSIVEVKFIPLQNGSSTEEKSTEAKYMCPSCRKTLGNTLRLILPKRCGHVICQICCDKFVKQSGKCFVCDGDSAEKDLILLHTEGTSYAGHGDRVVAEKYDVAFQG